MPYFVRIVLLTIAWLTATGPAGAQTSWQWAAVATNAGSTNAQVVVDGLGNTYVAGNFSGTLTLGPFTLTSAGATDIFVARLNAAGQWTQATQAGGIGADYTFGLALDLAGNPVVCGYFTNTAAFGTTTLTSAGRADAFVARLAAGQWVQATRAGGPDDDYAQSLAVDMVGRVAVVGTFSGTASFSSTVLNSAGAADVYVAWLSPTGIWTQAVRAGGTAFDSASSLALDAAGNATITGYYFSNDAAFGSVLLPNAGGADVFIARLDPSGGWVQAVRAGGSGSEYGRQVALDATGQATVIGDFSAPTQFGATALQPAGGADVFVARLSPAGTWTQAVRAGGLALDVPDGLAVDGSGNAIITGLFNGMASFGPITLTSSGGRDIFVATLSPTGTWVQAVQAGGTGDDQGTDVVVGADGTVTVAGLYAAGASLGPLPLTGSSGGAFVGRLTGLPLASATASSITAFGLAPNPATTHVQVNWTGRTGGSQIIQVLDNLGRIVRQLPVPSFTGSAQVDLQGLPAGLFIVRYGPAAARLQIE
jgi:hypothetical protein